MNILCPFKLISDFVCITETSHTFVFLKGGESGGLEGPRALRFADSDPEVEGCLVLAGGESPSMMIGCKTSAAMSCESIFIASSTGLMSVGSFKSSSHSNLVGLGISATRTASRLVKKGQ